MECVVKINMSFERKRNFSEVREMFYGIWQMQALLKIECLVTYKIVYRKNIGNSTSYIKHKSNSYFIYRYCKIRTMFFI